MGALRASDVMRLDRFRPVRAVVLLPLLLLTGCSMHSLTAFYTAGAVGAHERGLIAITVVLMAFVFIPVLFFTLFFAWRYRESNSKAAYSPNWSHSNLLEVFLWGGPVVIIAILGTLAWISTHQLDPYKVVPSENKDPVKVEAIAMDWKWLFIYPEYNVASVNELAMPVDTPISLHLTSDTVMTAIMIPRLGSQIFVMSGMQTQLHLLPQKKGDFMGKNYQYNGKGFASEKFHALSMSDQQFKNWIKKAKESGKKLDSERYADLTKPSEIKDVIYFSSVKPNLFDDVMKKYHKGTPRNRMTRTAER